MRIATWNLNNRVGKVPFRLEAADAAMALDADVLVFTEFFPQQHENQFRARLADAGWDQQLMSIRPSEVANRVLIASRLALDPLPLDLPTFDQQFPPNLLGVRVPSLGLSVLGVRVPAYTGQTAQLLLLAWDWLEAMAAVLKSSPSVVLGDLNVSADSKGPAGGNHFRRILNSGWPHGVESTGPTFFGKRGHMSEIDHILATEHCTLSDAASDQAAEGFLLCGSSGAISDHAALACSVQISSSFRHEAKA